MNTLTNSQPAKKLKLKKERIAVLNTPQSIRTTDGTFSPTATCNCTATC